MVLAQKSSLETDVDSNRVLPATNCKWKGEVVDIWMFVDVCVGVCLSPHQPGHHAGQPAERQEPTGRQHQKNSVCAACNKAIIGQMRVCVGESVCVSVCLSIDTILKMLKKKNVNQQSVSQCQEEGAKYFLRCTYSQKGEVADGWVHVDVMVLAQKSSLETDVDSSHVLPATNCRWKGEVVDIWMFVDVCVGVCLSPHQPGHHAGQPAERQEPTGRQHQEEGCVCRLQQSHRWTDEGVCVCVSVCLSV